MGKNSSELQKAQDLMSEGKYEEARPILKELRHSNPDDPIVVRYLGNTYAYTGFLGKARKIWREGIKKFPQNVDLLYNLGLADYFQGNFARAKKFWLKAWKLSPDDGEILFNLGQAYRDEGKIRKAIKFWKMALKANPDNVETMNNIGVGFGAEKMYGAAATWFKKAVEKDANYALGHFNLANALMERGEFETAEKHAEKAAELDPATHMKSAGELLKSIDIKRRETEEDL